MAHIVEDNVRESSSSTGTGNLAFGGSLNTGRAFSSVCADGDTFDYAIHHTTNNEWEIGVGTYETTGNLLLRTTPTESSNGGSAVNFSSGGVRIEMIMPASRALFVRQMAQLTGVVRVDAGVPTADSDVTDIVAAASDTAAGKVELATTAEQLTGTDAARACTPDSVAALWEKGTDNSGGATITMGDGYQFDLITSTTTITALAFTTDKAGRMALLRFTTSRQVTHNATSLISPTGANLLMSPGEFLLVESLGSGNFRIIQVLCTADQGRAVFANTSGGTQTNSTTNISICTHTFPANTLQVGSVWEYFGYYTFVHTAAATPTLTLELLVNGVVIDSIAVTPQTTAATFAGTVHGFLTIRSVGAGGTCMANCRVDGNVVVANGNDGSTSTGTDAIDTTVSRSTELRMRMTTAVASNTLNITQGFIRKVR